MRSQKPFLRRIADWQQDCIDRKWKWSLPWGVFSASLLVFMVVATSPLNHVFLNELSHYAHSESRLEFSWRRAEINQRSWLLFTPWMNSQPIAHRVSKGALAPRTLAYHRLVKTKLAPIAALHPRFSDMPWDE